MENKGWHPITFTYANAGPRQIKEIKVAITLRYFSRFVFYFVFVFVHLNRWEDGWINMVSYEIKCFSFYLMQSCTFLHCLLDFLAYNDAIRIDIYFICQYHQPY